MADRFTGVWNGENVSFPKEWRGIKLTDAQCEDLLAGKVIEVVGLTSQRTGNPYGVTAKLGHLVSKTTGNEYVGIEQVDFLPRESLVAHGIKFPVPRSFCQHEFTEDEPQFDDITMLCFRYNGPVNENDDSREVSVAVSTDSSDTPETT